MITHDDTPIFKCSGHDRSRKKFSILILGSSGRVLLYMICGANLSCCLKAWRGLCKAAVVVVATSHFVYRAGSKSENCSSHQILLLLLPLITRRTDTLYRYDLPNSPPHTRSPRRAGWGPRYEHECISPWYKLLDQSR